MIIMMIIENDNNSDNDDKDNNNDDNNKILVDSPHKGAHNAELWCYLCWVLKQQSSFRWFETPCPSRNVTVMWYT